MFFAAVLSSSVCSIGGIAQNVLCLFADYDIKWVMVFMSFIGYCTLLQCVLGVFIMRLHVTFRDSQLALSTMKRNILGYSFLTMQVLWASEFALTAWVVFDPNR